MAQLSEIIYFDFLGVYIVGATCGQFIQLPAGLLLDRIGPRYTRVVSAAVFALGCLIFAVSSNNRMY